MLQITPKSLAPATAKVSITTLPLAAITFDLPLHPRQVSAFRGAIVDKVGWEHDLYHNHLPGQGGFLRRYPRIQYQLHNGRAGLWGIGEGADALRNFMNAYDGLLVFDEGEQQAALQDFYYSRQSVGITDRPYDYRLCDWIALNKETLAEWDAAQGLVGKAALLERILRNQLVNFLNHLGLPTETRVELAVTEIVKEKSQPYREIRFKALNINFSTNILLPPGMGIGKAASEGYGRIMPE